ncbi:MAG TPA: hypothetical protein DHW45_17495, partial [Candidatus Latescibacteria bacterium]|nr:hypothetical protein [Candidatus Latescibacterota bacterium]
MGVARGEGDLIWSNPTNMAVPALKRSLQANRLRGLQTANRTAQAMMIPGATVSPIDGPVVAGVVEDAVVDRIVIVPTVVPT